jgi:hypothetical protein
MVAVAAKGLFSFYPSSTDLPRSSNIEEPPNLLFWGFALDLHLHQVHIFRTGSIHNLLVADTAQ